MSDKSLKHIVIIGAGPSGLSALEQLMIHIEKHQPDDLLITLIEAGNQWGNGWVYDVNQPDTNWLNIPERSIDLPGRPKLLIGKKAIPSFPNYTGWKIEAIDVTDHDYFPPRATLGHYLQERLSSLLQPLMSTGLVDCRQAEVLDIALQEGRFQLTLNHGEVAMADEVLLAIGHQPTEDSTEIKKWSQHARAHQSIQFYKSPYPTTRFTSQRSFKGRCVAIRGFGLAMIDVMRALTEGLGGRFELTDPKCRSMIYHPGKRDVSKLIPFSLNGMPPVPKQLNQELDNYFAPSEGQLRQFRKTLERKLEKPQEITSIQFLTDAVAELAATIFLNLDNIRNNDQISTIVEVAKQWLNNTEPQHPALLKEELPPDQMIKELAGMATATAPISLDYTIGQVWRHLQPTMYEALSFSKLDAAVVAKFIERNEQLKRYSYGPPVDSLQQMLALIEADILVIRAVDDPDVRTTREGWHFEQNETELTADMMINSVLSEPQLIAVRSPLIKSLLKNGFSTPVHPDLGAKIRPDGCVVATNGSALPLAIIGRLALGSILGIDSIHECFGNATRHWAQGVVLRMTPSR